jgi:hypothetical protein
MGTLVFVCPATGQEVSTGIEIELLTLVRLRSEEVRCPCCREIGCRIFESWITTPPDILPDEGWVTV